MAVLRVKEPFACDDARGVFRVYRQGDLVDASDPVVTAGRQQFFESVETAASRSVTVEQATAAPNERRILSTRKKVEPNG